MCIGYTAQFVVFIRQLRGPDMLCLYTPFKGPLCCVYSPIKGCEQVNNKAINDNKENTHQSF